MSKSVHQRYRGAFVQGLAAALGIAEAEVDRDVKTADPAHGDLSFATFALAKTRRKPPPAIAAELAAGLRVAGLEIGALGGYVNARFAASAFTGEVIDAARSSRADYARSDVGHGRTVVIDYSSPNIAKPIAFHHIRSTVIGHALANLYRATGHRVEGINYLGDWGKQFGLVAVGFEEYGDPARRNDMTHLVEVYVRANARAETDPAFDERARAFFKKMEQGDADALALWRSLREISLRDFRPIYQRLGIEFEHYEGESLYQDRTDATVAEVARVIGVRESDGASIVDMPYAEGEPPVLLRKNDGTTLYATRDIAAAIDRFQRFAFDRSLYVVAADQALHFRQLFAVLERMGFIWAKHCVHVNFGRVHGMSTRRGQLVLLNDVLDEARNRALEKVLENQKAARIQTDDPQALAEQIGLGAIVFGDLKNRRGSDYTFDWDEQLAFEGHTGPYLQYAHARAKSILAKGGAVPDRYDAGLLVLPEEQALVRSIALVPVAVLDAVEANEPSHVARALLDIAAAFSRWYSLGNHDRDKRVLIEHDDALRAARLALTDATGIALAAGLRLLGVPTPQSM